MAKLITKENVEDILALTPLQKGILFHHLSSGENGLYQNLFTLKLSGVFDLVIFKKAWEEVISTNEVLRTVYMWENVNTPIQIVLKSKELIFDYYDFSDKNKEEALFSVEKTKETNKNRQIDLTKDPFKVILCKISSNIYEMIISNHHILYDGWSNSLIFKEFFEAYNHLINGKSSPNYRNSKTDYKEYIKWVQEQNKESNLNYWETYLKGFHETTTLAISEKNANRYSVNQQLTHTLLLQEEFKKKLNNFSKLNDLTMASPLYLAWGILLKRYSQKNDIVFGTTISGRPPSIRGIENMVGLFINTVPLRIDFDSSTTLLSSLKSVNNMIIERKDYEWVSLLDIKEVSEINHKDSLFNSIVVIENYPFERKGIETNLLLDSKILSYSSYETTNYDLTLRISLLEDDIELNLLYNSHFFNDYMAKQLLNHFMNILNEILLDTNKSINDIEMLSTNERKLIFQDFNQTDEQYPDITIHDWFEDQVLNRPNEIAVTYQNKKVTYKELNNMANRLARVILEKSQSKNPVIGIMAERSVELIVGIFAILKTGSAYLPLNDLDPIERKKAILHDSNMELLLVSETVKQNLHADLKAISLPIKDERYLNYSSENLGLLVESTNLAYILYTSGSTGNPKGVMIEHRSVINRINWMQKAYQLNSEDVILQKTPTTFDVSVWELFWWYFNGASVCMLPSGEERNPEKIINAIETNKVSHIHFVPSMFNEFLTFVEKNKQINRLKSLKYIYLSGEAIKVNHVEKFNRVFNTLNEVNLVNLYGPTEATIDVTYYNYSRKDTLASIPIGKPIDNTKLYILDDSMNVVPIGVVGELYISGAGVSIGYINQPELTNAQFVPNPFREEVMYKTGDLVEWMPDGNIKYIGRKDFQVKLRGYRIELGEIESKLLLNKDIHEAVVVSKRDKSGDLFLSAYVTGDILLNQADIKSKLNQTLPSYMVPSSINIVDRLPLNSNGKINRALLRDLPEKTDGSHNKVSPVTKLQKRLLEVWEELLGKKIGIHDHFFDVGGNSLKIIKLQAMIEEKLPYKVSITDLFSYPTIESLTTYFEAKEKEKGIPTITPIKVENEFLVTTQENNDKVYFEYYLSEDVTRVLFELAKRESIVWEKILVSIFGYSIDQISPSNNVSVQVLMNDNLIETVEINLTRLSDFIELFNMADKQLNGDPNSATSNQLERLNKLQVSKEFNEILPFIYRKKSREYIHRNLLGFFDIIVSMEHSGDAIKLLCEYNENKLLTDKVESFFNDYVQLIEIICEKLIMESLGGR
ncbi:non-ribosomal peptide synthetase [Bacillus pseudomycoides]|uniref:non-ribosomal peptide synthetase n=1 Tax=Bacillus pseudomycoides TaxID=64104 RepID=UPI000BEB2FE6|nr:non-ribosomal peptide synthetase [Bacillus pseudomycoides]PDX99224.1 hypothetical protein COO07_17535 [Bacillus pseudomycoides]PEK80738.1 hypothetical protein CN597_10015 [Bacillus pseudomycoides]